MKRINDNFEVSEDAEYTLVSPFEIQVRKGNAVAGSGGTAVAWSGGTAVAGSGGTAVAWSGGKAYQNSDLIKIANDYHYNLIMDPDGYFYAGCRGPLTRAEALKYWDREDDRACLFTLAIGICT